MNTLEAAEELRGELTRGLVEAIRIPSLSGREGRVVEYLAETMRRLDYDEVVVDGMGNLRGRMGSGPYVIALDGHCDTVDVGDPGLWTHDPFGGAEVDGKIYGRGASDQKAGVVAAIFAGALLKRRGLPPEITLYVVASVQEEDCDGLCWQYIVREEGLRPDMVVLTEPTSLGI
ncbi:MAG: M20/M25/M40 family metallo-hydrolase, partial [Candidatus Marinimicrobia bacterium]|nr:M20/M25/M40 family metallo-hydrolase [Candidatus Neomarinimicrobiota bacterium]